MNVVTQIRAARDPDDDRPDDDRRREEHLREAEKMEVIGRMAGGIVHDFNNLLTGVLLYCDLLSAGLESIHIENLGSVCGDLCRQVQEVRLAAEQGAALTRQLLSIARKQVQEPRPVSINEIVRSTENLLRRLIGEHVELLAILDDQAGLVLADPTQLRQILLNLVLNARDAMTAGGKIRFEYTRCSTPWGRGLRKIPARCFSGHPRQRLRHRCRNLCPDVRAIFHHQESGKRHGFRPSHRTAHCQRNARNDRSRERAGMRHFDQHLFSHGWGGGYVGLIDRKKTLIFALGQSSTLSGDCSCSTHRPPPHSAQAILRKSKALTSSTC